MALYPDRLNELDDNMQAAVIAFLREHSESLDLQWMTGTAGVDLNLLDGLDIVLNALGDPNR